MNGEGSQALLYPKLGPGSHHTCALSSCRNARGQIADAVREIALHVAGRRVRFIERSPLLRSSTTRSCVVYRQKAHWVYSKNPSLKTEFYDREQQWRVGFINDYRES